MRAPHFLHAFVASIGFDSVGCHAVAQLLGLFHFHVHGSCGGQELAHALKGERHHEVAHDDDRSPNLRWMSAMQGPNV